MTKCRNRGEVFIFMAPDSSPLRNCTYLQETVAKTPQIIHSCCASAAGSTEWKLWRPWGHLVPLYTKNYYHPMLGVESHHLAEAPPTALRIADTVI